MMPELVDSVIVRLPPDEIELLKKAVANELRNAKRGDLCAYAYELSGLLASLGRRSPPIDWRPIETAPKDGSRILLWTEVGIPSWGGPQAAVGRWSGYWSDDNCDEFRSVTHWAPINPPEATDA